MIRCSINARYADKMKIRMLEFWLLGFQHCRTIIQVMKFKCRGVNTVMPENTAMPMFLTSCEKCTHGNMAESKLL